MKKLLELLSKNRNYVEKLPEDVYSDVAEDTEFSSEDIAKIGGLESQHGKFNKPLAGGSARGLFQFQPETAEDLIPGSSATLDDMNTQAALMKAYLIKNRQKNIEDAYAMHNLGPGRGSKLIQADESVDIKDIIPANVIEANSGLYDVGTVGDAKKKIKEKLDSGKEGNGALSNFLELFKEKK